MSSKTRPEGRVPGGDAPGRGGQRAGLRLDPSPGPGNGGGRGAGDVPRGRTGAPRVLAAALPASLTLYLTRFSGCIEGLLCVSFSPEGLPAPPVIPPFVFMTRVSAEQALVTADVIVTDGLRLWAS